MKNDLLSLTETEVLKLSRSEIRQIKISLIYYATIARRYNMPTVQEDYIRLVKKIVLQECDSASTVNEVKTMLSQDIKEGE